MIKNPNSTLSSGFPLRPLWLGSSFKVQLNEGFSLGIPKFMTLTDIDSVSESACKRIKELGYNALIIGAWGAIESIAETPSSSVNSWFKAFKQHGIAVIVKPSILKTEQEAACPLDPNWSSSILPCISGCSELIDASYVLWESLFQHPNFIDEELAEYMTHKDLAVMEMQKIESELAEGQSLIYYLSSRTSSNAKRHALWIPSLLDDAPKGTTIAFSSLSGSPFHSQLSLNPLWKALKNRKCPSSTALLPVFNAGAVEEGEGLWPLLLGSSLNKVLSRMHGHCFSGMIALSNSIPAEGNFLDANLWMAGQSTALGENSESLLESWLNTHYFSDNEEIIPLLELSQSVINTLSLLRANANGTTAHPLSPECCRAKAESLRSQIKELECDYKMISRKLKTKDSASKPSLLDYYPYFIYDAQRILYGTGQQLKIPLPNLMNKEEHKPSFWTSCNTKSSSQKGTIAILKEAKVDSSDPLMQKIYSCNYAL
jgi:hypothetical protein